MTVDLSSLNPNLFFKYKDKTAGIWKKKNVFNFMKKVYFEYIIFKLLPFIPQQENRSQNSLPVMKKTDLGYGNF